MNNYQFTAWDQAGNKLEGLKQATREEDVINDLRNQGFIPVSISQTTGSRSKKKTGQPSVRYKKVKAQALSTFCWQLGTMLDGGLGITTAMETIASEIENRYFGHILKSISTQIESGTPLSECIQRYPKVFNNLCVAMIQAGESGGSMCYSLQKLSEYYANKDKLARKVKSALSYPIFVVGFVILIVIAMMTFIIPRFTSMFDQMQGELPAFTRGFMYVYDSLMVNSPYIVIGIIAIVSSIVLYGKTKNGRYRLCHLGLRIPLFGKIKLQAFVSVFCRTLSTLTASGVPMLEAFSILANMTDNDVLKEGIIATKEKLVEGSSISASMSMNDIFPDVAIKMTQIGEQSGSLSAVMEKTSEYYERKVDYMVTSMLSLMEPILIVSVGSIVLLVILAMYLPIFTMGGK